MKIKRTRVALAVAVAMGAGAWPAYAQQAPAAAPATVASADTLETIVVSGIRASEEKSLDTKRQADTLVEVITAEDIGKMPDKNIADSLQHLPGVTTSSAGANEGGFDENDRVSMRGTNPSLTQTLINGHNIASGDWFVLDQTGTVGRSVSYTLLPSELVSQVIVKKSSEASLVEGGVAGSVDIITRKPLDFGKPLTLEASAGAVYADLPSKTDPQFSALVNWKNDAGNLGVMVQGFYEQRHLRRDGQELLNYEKILPTSTIVTGGVNGTVTAHPDLANVSYPGYIGSAFFEQERKRSGGLLDVQFKPSNDLSLDLSYFTSNLNATNYNRNYILWLTHFLAQGNVATAGSGASAVGVNINPGYTITNGTLTNASFSAVPGVNYGVYDQISRPDESANTNFLSLDGRLRVDSSLVLTGKLGVSRGDGKTPRQDVLETNPGTGNGGGYTLAGTGSAASWNLGNTVNNSPAPGGVPVAFGWIFGDQGVDVKDSENWLQLDGDYAMGAGTLNSIKFGARVSTHDRSSAGVHGQGPGCDHGPFSWGISPYYCANPAGSPYNGANYPTGYQNYPGNFASGLGGSFPTNVWYFSPGQLASFDSQFTVPLDATREDWNSEYALHEKDTALYVQGNFDGPGWSGNAGLRLVQTKESATNNVAATAQTPGAHTLSAFGIFLPVTTDHTYTEVLPSFNLKLDVNKDVVARFALSETMTRPDYSALAGPVSLTPPGSSTGTGSGTGSNPDLKPIRSTNFDAGVEWYFAKHSLVSATLFYMKLADYIAYGQVNKSFMTYSSTNQQGSMLPYVLTVPINSNGRVRGLELAYQQEINKNFGLNANYTYADGKQTSDIVNNDDRLVGTSKNTYNVSGYFENEMFSARLTYTYRSAFYSGLDRNTAFTQDSIGTLGMSLGYTINPNLSVTLDGMNLNNPTLKYYASNTDQPRAFYKNGSQYYANIRFKF